MPNTLIAGCHVSFTFLSLLARHFSCTNRAQWLLTLTSPPPELEPVILDPFMGSGTTGLAARALGLDFVGVELEPDFAELARRRIEGAPAEAPAAP